MKRPRHGRCFALALAGFAAALAIVSPAYSGQAASRVTVDAIALPEGGQGVVEVNAEALQPPGLGAWLIDVAYDPAEVTATGCSTAQQLAVCNHAFTSDSVRMAGVDSAGISGDFLLGTVGFSCQGEGLSQLTLVIHRFADVGASDIQADAVDGSITCGTPAETGDVNCSGSVDSIDAALILQFVAALLSSMECEGVGDVNDSGFVDAVDAALVLQSVAGLIVLS